MIICAFIAKQLVANILDFLVSDVTLYQLLCRFKISINLVSSSFSFNIYKFM